MEKLRILHEDVGDERVLQDLPQNRPQLKVILPLPMGSTSARVEVLAVRIGTNSNSGGGHICFNA